MAGPDLQPTSRADQKRRKTLPTLPGLIVFAAPGRPRSEITAHTMLYTWKAVTQPFASEHGDLGSQSFHTFAKLKVLLSDTRMRTSMQYKRKKKKVQGQQKYSCVQQQQQHANTRYCFVPHPRQLTAGQQSLAPFPTVCETNGNPRRQKRAASETEK